MDDNRWKQLVEMAKERFDDVSAATEPLAAETPEGEQRRGTRDILEFENSRGRFRLVRENHPVVLDKKEHFTHRPGDTARTEYKFSETEFSHKLKVYRERDFEEWEEITLDKLGL